jgi:succinate dehydrogenase/fumarate reductase cytochrome b subunit
VLRGASSFDAVVDKSHRIPFATGLEILAIYVPLAFHALYGIRLSFAPLPKAVGQSGRKSWAELLQRITGGVALIFIIAHFYQFRLQVFLGRMSRADYFSELCASLSSTNGFGIPVVAFGYLIGIAACAFHFAYGLKSFCINWALVVSGRARKLTEAFVSVLGIALFLIGVATVLYLATGSAL